MSRIKVGVIGASGYTGEELVRLLARHPHAELAVASSRSLAGTPVAKAMPKWRETLPHGLCFTGANPDALAKEPVDIWFLALPHGVATEFARPLVAAGRRVIDLSADFRLRDPELYRSYYGHEHPAPDLMRAAPYVIPELAEAGWEKAPLIACPGCYPTSIQIPLTPLLRAGVISPPKGSLVIDSHSGVSGAGKKAEAAYLYCEREGSVKAYGIPRHRHLSEIEENLSLAAGREIVTQFNPHLSPMVRGISTTITVPSSGATLEALYAAWGKTYAASVFVGILPPGEFPDTAHVAGTNRCDISAVHDARTGNFVITSAIDNLMKGAGGQAVQIMNLACGFPEAAGLI